LQKPGKAEMKLTSGIRMNLWMDISAEPPLKTYYHLQVQEIWRFEYPLPWQADQRTGKYQTSRQCEIKLILLSNCMI